MTMFRRGRPLLAVTFFGLGAVSPAFATSTSAGSKPPTHVGKIPFSDRFTTTAAAAAHCPNDVVVWTTLSREGDYHLAGSRYYGKTKHGAYVCSKDALAAGYHQSKE